MPDTTATERVKTLRNFLIMALAEIENGTVRDAPFVMVRNGVVTMRAGAEEWQVPSGEQHITITLRDGPAEDACADAIRKFVADHPAGGIVIAKSTDPIPPPPGPPNPPPMPGYRVG